MGIPFLSSFSTYAFELTDEDLFTAFQEPDSQAKPFVRWWWNGLRITKEEITRELKVLKNVGIGGVEINSIRFPETADPMSTTTVDWLSREWLDIISHTVDEAKRLGLICDVIVGSGWPFGGTFVKREDQSMIMALGTKELKGPLTLTLSRQDLEKSVDPPIGFKYNDPQKKLMSIRLAPLLLKDLGTVVDLDHTSSSDQITVEVPEGDHVLYYLVQITGFMAVIHGAPGADGPVLNHFKKNAVNDYLERMSDAFDSSIGKIGSNFRSVFVDSLELEGANWVDDFYTEFERRRSYSIKPYLPFILFKTGKMGKVLNEKYGSQVESGLKEELDRIRYDFELTRMELFRERFLDTFLEWCSKNKVRSRVQAYGQEMHPLDSSLQIDIPECETWISSAIGQDPREFDFKYATGPCMVNRFVSSAARLAGKKLVSCEEITNTGFVFNASLQHIKITGDQSNISGVTHSILHGFNYSPPDAPFPGWIRYGTYFNERNPWWPHLNNWISYKSRLSAVFQRATLMSDVTVYHPLADLWSKHGLQRDPWPDNAFPDYIHNIWQAIHQCGNGCDYISDQIIQSADLSQGSIRYNDRNYSLLLVVETRSMPEATAEALRRYAASGGRLAFVGRLPDEAPGFYQYRERNKQVQDAVIQIKKGANVKVVKASEKESGLIQWFSEIQKQFNLPAYVRFSERSPSISQVRYQYNQQEIFFITNSSINSSKVFYGEFNVAPGKTAWVWDPETGTRSVYKTEGAYNRLKIQLAPAASLLIVFDKSSKKGSPFTLREPSGLRLDLPDAWNLKLNYVDGRQETIQSFQLKDFKDEKTLETFGGVASYETSFSVQDITGYEFLNLGKVIGISEVTLNGINLGVHWYGDHIYPIKDALKNGDNKLTVKLTTTLGNYMHSIPENKDAKKWVIDRKQPLYSMGMIGPIHIGGWK